MLKVEKGFSIKQLIEKEKFIVIIDTNILLNIYRYSPDFSDFAMKCLDSIKDSIYLPSLVRLEYGKHCRGYYAKMNKRIDNAKKNIQNQIDTSRSRVLNSLNDLKRMQFPEIDQLSTELDNKINELTAVKDAFFDDRSVVDYVSNAWDSDILMNLVSYVENLGHIFQELSLQQIYDWDEQGEKRYKDSIPPGYMDAKNKTGIRRYSDFFIWKEIIRFAREQNKDVIFVTDDTKPDWWTRNQGQLVFRRELLDEFSETSHRIVPLTSDLFYSELSDAYSIERLDAVEIALNMSDPEYGALVAERVFDSICEELYYNATDYIDGYSAHIGTEGIDEFEIIDHEFIDAARIDREGSAFTYQLKFRIVIEGTSYDYWGRDDDTKEVIKSLGRDHVFEGDIFVNIEREADIFIDIGEADFETAIIVDGNLEETEYSDRGEDDFQEYGELGNCPDCGGILNVKNSGGNGFCVDCAPNH